MLCLWVALALAGKNKDSVPEGPDPDEIEAAERAACAKDVPENYQIHTGFGEDASPATAIETARVDAQRRALNTLCSGKSDTRCAVMRRHLEDWKQPYYNPITQRACAHVGVNRLWIDDDQREQEALASALADLAAQVAARVAGQDVALRSPVWGTSGCDAGDLGVAVLSELRGALGSANKRLVPVGTKGAPEVTVTAKVTERRVFLDASVRLWGEEAVLPVKGTSFSADLFAVEQGNRACWLDENLGLPGGHRDGPDGLRVWVDTGMQGTICEGDSGSASLSVSQPARVKVWSVDKTGKAFLVWPPPNSDGLVESTADLGSMVYYQSPAGGEERLVALAVPKGQRFPQIDAWTGFCRHPGSFSVQPYGQTAGTAAALAVHAYTSPACVQRGVVARAPQAMPEDIPVCPKRLGE